MRKRTDAPARPQKGFRAYASPPCSRMATHPQEVPAHRTPPCNVGEKMAPTHRHTTREEPTDACRRTRGHHCPLEPSARLRYPTRHTRSAHNNTKNEPRNGQGRNAPTRRRCANNRRLCAPERLVGPWARGVQGYENGRFAFHPSAPLEPPRMASPEEHAEPRLKFPQHRLPLETQVSEFQSSSAELHPPVPRPNRRYASPQRLVCDVPPGFRAHTGFWRKGCPHVESARITDARERWGHTSTQTQKHILTTSGAG